MKRRFDFTQRGDTTTFSDVSVNKFFPSFQSGIFSAQKNIFTLDKLTYKLSPSTRTQQLDSAYQKTVLENGIRIVTETFPAVRSASIGVWINAGSRNETQDNSGIAHFLEHMVFKGTKNYSVKEISKSMESLGGYLNAFTTKEHTCFLARVLDEYVEDAFAVLADLTLHPLFPAKELSKEKLVVLEELKSVEDDPEDWIFELLEKNLYPHQQLGVPIIGTEESVKKFSVEKLKNFRKEFYFPSNLVIAATGNVQHERIVD